MIKSRKGHQLYKKSSRKIRTRKGRQLHKKNRRKIRTQKGGKLVGQGSYGCVYKKNPLLCRGETESVIDSSIVTKLMTFSEARDEYQTGQLINNVYPEQTTIITPLTDPCAPSENQMEDNKIEDCPIDFKYNKSILKYKDGGEDLDKFRIEPMEIIMFLDGYLELMKGVSEFHKRSIFHCDIRPANIVALRNDDGSIKIRLIDIGFVQYVYYESDKDYYIPDKILNRNNVYWPFSNHYLFDDSEKQLEEHLKEHLTNLEKYVLMYAPEDTFYSYEKSSFFRIIIKINKLNADFIRTGISELSEINRIDRYRLLLGASDMYGLGLTLARVFYRLNGNKKTDNDKDNIYYNFYNVIRNLMNPDISNLASLDKCISGYTNTLTVLKDSLGITSGTANRVVGATARRFNNGRTPFSKTIKNTTNPLRSLPKN